MTLWRVEKTKKIAQKLKTMELVQIYFIVLIKLQLLPVLISLYFFSFFSSKCFSPGSTALQISTFMLPYGCLLRVLNIAVLVVHDDQEERGGGQEERLDENGNPSLLHNAFPIMDPQLRPLSIYRYEGRGAAFQLCCALLCGQIAHCNDETGSAYCRWYFNYPDPHNCKLDYPIHHNCKLDYEDLGSS